MAAPPPTRSPTARLSSAFPTSRQPSALCLTTRPAPTAPIASPSKNEDHRKSRKTRDQRPHAQSLGPSTLGHQYVDLHAAVRTQDAHEHKAQRIGWALSHLWLIGSSTSKPHRDQNNRASQLSLIKRTTLIKVSLRKSTPIRLKIACCRDRPLTVLS
jgi:hypothetical protein